MHDFRKLEVWKKSRFLVKQIYLSSQHIPKEEVWGLVSQLKRSSISIPSNIAEGCGRGSNKSFAYHLDVAIGSAFELETHILICNDLNFLDDKRCSAIIEKIKEIIKMIIGLKKQIK